MAKKKKRRGLTPEQRKKGVLASLKSPKTPAGLKKGLKEYARKQGYIK